MVLHGFEPMDPAGNGRRVMTSRSSLVRCRRCTATAVPPMSRPSVPAIAVATVGHTPRMFSSRTSLQRSTSATANVSSTPCASSTRRAASRAITAAGAPARHHLKHASTARSARDNDSIAARRRCTVAGRFASGTGGSHPPPSARGSSHDQSAVTSPLASTSPWGDPTGTVAAEACRTFYPVAVLAPEAGTPPLGRAPAVDGPVGADTAGVDVADADGGEGAG